MSFVEQSSRLTDEGLMTLLSAAVAHATKMGRPQCIVIVDPSGVELASFRMKGSYVLSMLSAGAKAKTAASINAPSRNVPEHARVALGTASKGAVTGLRGGLPIRVGGHLVGGIGVGSGSGEQDEEVARVALAAIGAETIE